MLSCWLKLCSGCTLGVLLTATLWADFACESSVSYSWKQAEKSKAVFFSQLERKGVDEAAAKQALEKALGLEKERALESCRELHENLAACISSRLVNTSAARSLGSFSVRKKLEEAIEQDCEQLTGDCEQATTTAAVCRDLEPAAEPEAAAEDSKKVKKK